MTRSEIIGQLRQFITLEGDEEKLLWWHQELSTLAGIAQQRAVDARSGDYSDDQGSGASPPFVGTG